MRLQSYLPDNLGKAFQDAYNQGGLLILQDLLNEWVTKGVASDPLDFSRKAVKL
jgi:hypothetical protein